MALSQKEKTDSYRERNKHRLADLEAAWRRRNPVKALLIGVKRRAKQKGWEFDLTEDDLTIPEVCPVLGIPLMNVRHQRTDFAPSVDRIHNDIGYVKGNVIVVSWRANRLKSDSNHEERMKIESFYRKLKGIKVTVNNLTIKEV